MSDGFTKILGFTFVAQNETYWTSMKRNWPMFEIFWKMRTQHKFALIKVGFFSFPMFRICNIDIKMSTGPRWPNSLCFWNLPIEYPLKYKKYIFSKLAYRICFLKAELIHLNVHVVGVIKRVRTICKTEHDDELEEKIWSECFSLPFSRISSSF